MGKWEQNMLQEYGWYMHAIPAEECDGIHANYHTHGLQDRFGHFDFQIVLDMDPEIAHGIFCTLTEDIKSGKVFKEEISYEGVIEGLEVKFKKYRETGRDVLRILLPDENGYLPDDSRCDLYYQYQLDIFE